MQCDGNCYYNIICIYSVKIKLLSQEKNELKVADDVNCYVLDDVTTPHFKYNQYILCGICVILFCSNIWMLGNKQSTYPVYMNMFVNYCRWPAQPASRRLGEVLVAAGEMWMTGYWLGVMMDIVMTSRIVLDNLRVNKKRNISTYLLFCWQITIN